MHIRMFGWELFTMGMFGWELEQLEQLLFGLVNENSEKQSFSDQCENGAIRISKNVVLIVHLEQCIAVTEK